MTVHKIEQARQRIAERVKGLAADLEQTQAAMNAILAGGGLANQGSLLPWNNAKASQFRFRPGELTIWTGHSNHGKSAVLSQCQLWFALQEERSLIISPEMPTAKLAVRAVRQACGTNSPAPDWVAKFMPWWGLWTTILEVPNPVPPGHLIEYIRHAPELQVTHVIIDSLMCVENRRESIDDMTRMVAVLKDIADRQNIHVHLVAHTRKTSRDSSQARLPGQQDIAGSSNIGNMADNVAVFWRNRKREEEREALLDEGLQGTDEWDLNERTPANILAVEKSRHGEWTGRMNLWFHPASLQYLTSNADKPMTGVRDAVEWT